jgi:hypothetical protein
MQPQLPTRQGRIGDSVAWDWDDETVEEMAMKLGVAVLTLIDHGVTREEVIEAAAGYYDRLTAKREEKENPGPRLRAVPLGGFLPELPSALDRDACSGCGYLWLCCQCDTK